MVRRSDGLGFRGQREEEWKGGRWRTERVRAEARGPDTSPRSSLFPSTSDSLDAGRRSKTSRRVMTTSCDPMSRIQRRTSEKEKVKMRFVLAGEKRIPES